MKIDMKPINAGTTGSTPAYAGFFRRFAAFAIDIAIGYVLLFVFSPGIRNLSFDSYDSNSSGYNSVMWVILFLAVLYGALMESSKLQGTLGKIILGIKVTNTEGGKISFINAVGRSALKALASTLATMGIGCLVAAFTKKKQALHDIPSHCLVVLRKSKQAVSTEPEAKAGAYAPQEYIRRQEQQTQPESRMWQNSSTQEVIERWDTGDAVIENVSRDFLPAIAAEFQNVLSTQLADAGLPMSNDDSVNQISVIGRFILIDGGKRALRYFSNGVGGKARLEVEGEAVVNGVRVADLHAQKDLGFAFQVFGGDNDRMLKICAGNCGRAVAEQAIKALAALRKESVAVPGGKPENSISGVGR